MKIKLSIIISLYKSGRYLAKLNNCLINQTYSNIEIIYINDESPDNSGSLAEEFEKKDSRIKIFHKPNSGQADSINLGVQKSTGQFIMFIDADDWIDLNTCELVVNKAVEYDADMVFWMGVKEYKHKSIHYPSFEYQSRIYEGNDLDNLRRRMMGLVGKELGKPMLIDLCNTGWAKLYNSSIIKDNNIKWVDTQKVGSSDVLFNAEFMLFIKRAYYLNEYLYHYNKSNPNSLTKNYSITLKDKYIYLFHRLENIITSQYPSDNKMKLALSNRIALSSINLALSLLNNKHNKSPYRIFDEIISSKMYQDAYSRIDYKYLTFPYKQFLIACRRNHGNLALWIANILRVLRIIRDRF